MFTLTDLLRWRAELHPEAIALVDERGDTATYAELHHRIEQTARRWRGRGVAAGDVVAVLDTNSVAFVVNLVAIGRAGAIPALFNWRLTAPEHAALLDVVTPVAVAAGHDLIDQLPNDLPAVRVALGPPGPTPPGWSSDVGPDGQPSEGPSLQRPPERPLERQPEPGDVFAIAFSSGTTGRAKGIPLRHESLARSIMVDGADIAGMHLGARHIMAAPMFHLAGLVNSLMGLARGAELHLRETFDPDRALDDIERLGVSYLTTVPAMLQAMVAAAQRRDATPDVASVEEITYGASPIAPELVREVTALFPQTGLRQFYGMTEVAGALTALTPADHDPTSRHHGSAGRVHPGYEVRLVDRHGVDVPDGQPGEILARGPSLFHGYWNDPAATADAFVDGWFATGDIATRDDGYLTIMDRAKDMIVTGGENVYPAEVEAVLYAHERVVEAAVIGVPDDRFGERVHAVVVVRPGSDDGETLDLGAIQAFCRKRLAGYKLPRSLELVDQLPRNATGKVLKKDLRAPHWADQARQV